MTVDPAFRFLALKPQREKDVDRLTQVVAGLRKEASLAKAELEARGEALRQVSLTSRKTNGGGLR